ncbi:MAG: ferritin [Nitrospirae bacterium]|nr:ferritin [Nitrospirota bacterium]
MKFFRCEICGEVYMGKSRPSNCPHCGALGKYLVPAADWTDENLSITELSDVSRSNLEKALQLEVNNAPFYRDASANAKTVELQGVFKALGKVEAEHASLVRKILGCEFPKPEPGREMATKDDTENLRIAHEREVFAAGFYKRASMNAAEPRVKKVFLALSEIETDHINLEEDFMNGGK